MQKRQTFWCKKGKNFGVKKAKKILLKNFGVKTGKNFGVKISKNVGVIKGKNFGIRNWCKKILVQKKSWESGIAFDLWFVIIVLGNIFCQKI